MRYRWLPEASGKGWIIITVTAALMVAALAYLSLSRPGHKPPAIAASPVVIGFAQVSRSAPAFDLPGLRGGHLRLSSLAGKPIVLNFWASTCDICRQESPAIARIARGAQRQVSFAGIDTLDSRSTAMAFIRRYRISYPIADDPQGSAAAGYGVPGLLVTYFLSPGARRIIGINVGALTARRLRFILRRLYGVSA